MKPVIPFLSCFICIQLFACNHNNNELTSTPNNVLNTDSMKLKITIGQTVLTATMYDNPTSADLISLLPLYLTLQDYAATEKISDLPRKLITKDAPAGYKPSAGDITIYAPWGNLAIFYKDFSYSSGLIVLGKIDGDMSVLKQPGSVQATMELIR
jgi:hypothetical protein